MPNFEFYEKVSNKFSEQDMRSWQLACDCHLIFAISDLDSNSTIVRNPLRTT